MIRYLLIGLLLVLSESTQKDSEEESIIIWNNIDRLTWEDFTGPPNDTSISTASCATSIYFKYRFTEYGRIVFYIYSYFLKNDSWVKSNEKSSWILSHENLHFDITEIFARKLRKEVSSFSFSKDRIYQQSDSILEIIIEELSVFQSLYDSETSHSKNYKAQDIWNEKINNLLKSLEDFSEIEIEADYK
jgi:hypothetical protein